jgi:RecA-family ATPase
MWAAEDDEHELWRRQQAIAQSMNVGLQDFTGKFILESFDGRDCTLAAVSYGSFGVTGKLEDFRQQVNDCRVDVAILDNIARLYGGNENDRHQVTAFIAELVGATAERGAALLLLGHPGRASGSEFSGSSAWENAVRARLWLSDKLPDQPRDDGAEPESDVRYLARRKANYSAHDLRTFHYQNGLFVPEAGEPVSGGLMDHTRRLKAERVVVDAFRKLLAMGLSPTDGDTSPNSLPKLIFGHALGEGLTKRELGDAMRRLMNDGKLVRAVIGAYSNRAPRYGLKET